MDMQELEITIDKEGRVQVEVKGIQGQQCLTASQNIENALGEVQTRVFYLNIMKSLLPGVPVNRLKEGRLPGKFPHFRNISGIITPVINGSLADKRECSNSWMME